MYFDGLITCFSGKDILTASEELPLLNNFMLLLGLSDRPGASTRLLLMRRYRNQDDHEQCDENCRYLRSLETRRGKHTIAAQP